MVILSLGWRRIVLIQSRISCFAAGSYDIFLAVSVRRPSWKDDQISIDDKEIGVKQPTALYDIDFTHLPTFDKHWAAVHAIALGMFFSVAATSALMLKTNFNASPPNDADTLEKDVGKQSE